MTRHLIISDLHENLTALKNAFLEAEKLGGFSDVWLLGDVVGHHSYNNVNSADCIACLNLLEKQKLVAVRGNWEQWLLMSNKNEQDLKDQELLKYQELLRRRFKELQDSGKIKLIRNWPAKKLIGDFTLIHGSPYDCDNNGHEFFHWKTYLFPWKADCVSTIFANKHVKTNYFMFGHTHNPGYFLYNGVFSRWIGIDKRRESISLIKYPGIHFAINPGSITIEGERDSGTALLMEDTHEQLQLTYFDVRHNSK